MKQEHPPHKFSHQGHTYEVRSMPGNYGDLAYNLFRDGQKVFQNNQILKFETQSDMAASRGTNAFEEICRILEDEVRAGRIA